MTSLVLDLRPVVRLTHEQFEQIAIANRDLHLELTAEGELIVMPPSGGNTGRRNAELTYQVEAWNQRSQLGEVFDSSTVFQLPNRAERSPDVAWVSHDRWTALTPEQQDTFPPVCPDFVIELRSKTDSLKTLQAKMQEYLDNGCRLGLLINNQDQQVEVYRAGQPKEVLQSPSTVDCDEVLPGFSLELRSIW